MRLTCPNCSAQYNVADDMIPVDGRDVQCSNCATTWFQEGRGRTPSEDAPREVRRAAPPPPPPSPEESDAPEDDPPQDDEAEQVAAQRVRRPMADKKTLDILRQERAHEARQRAAERRKRAEDRLPPDDSPVDEEVEAARAAAAAERARMAQAASVARARDVPPAPPEPDIPLNDEMGGRGPETPADDGTAEAIAMALRAATDDRAPDLPESDVAEVEAGGSAGNKLSRRDLFPDIEEINSSLRPDDRAMAMGDDEDEDLGDDVEGRSGFRLGFLLVFAVILTAVLLYVFAGRIGVAVPALEGPLAGYAAWVDGVRLALENSVNDLTSRILPPE